MQPKEGLPFLFHFAACSSVSLAEIRLVPEKRAIDSQNYFAKTTTRPHEK